MGWLVNFITGGAVTDIAKQLAAAYAAKNNAQTEQDKIAADLEIARLQALASVQNTDHAASMVRLLFALPFVVYVNKLVLWDKVLGWGVTDSLGPELTQIFSLILGFFFIHSVVSILKR